MASSRGVLLGLGVCVGLFCPLSAIGFAQLQKARAEARKGWNTKPVLVANEDIEAGSPIEFEKVSLRSMPEQFIDVSMIGPDRASRLRDQIVYVPLKKGDPLRWSDIDPNGDAEEVLFAARDIAGGPLSADDITVRSVSRALLTKSWVRGEEADVAFEQLVKTPFNAGDPILWSHLREEGARP